MSGGRRPLRGDDAGPPRGRATAAQEEELRKIRLALRRKKGMILIALAVALLFLAWILLTPGHHGGAKPKPKHSMVMQTISSSARPSRPSLASVDWPGQAKLMRAEVAHGDRGATNAYTAWLPPSLQAQHAGCC